jgi:hypothetical protein
VGCMIVFSIIFTYFILLKATIWKIKLILWWVPRIVVSSKKNIVCPGKCMWNLIELNHKRCNKLHFISYSKYIINILAPQAWNYWLIHSSISTWNINWILYTEIAEIWGIMKIHKTILLMKRC